MRTSRLSRGHDGKLTHAGDGLIAAAYRHRMSRALDPQLHTHVVVANMTRGPEDLRAAQVGRSRAWRIRPEDVEAWLEARANRPRQDSVAPARAVNVFEAIPRARRRRVRSGRLELADL
jgi:hypothetical protein